MEFIFLFLNKTVLYEAIRKDNDDIIHLLLTINNLDINAINIFFIPFIHHVNKYINLIVFQNQTFQYNFNI